jgi:hypothetical protein
VFLFATEQATALLRIICREVVRDVETADSIKTRAFFLAGLNTTWAHVEVANTAQVPVNISGTVPKLVVTSENLTNYYVRFYLSLFI